MHKFIVLPLLVLLAACTDRGPIGPDGPDGPAFAKPDKCSDWPTCRKGDGDGDGDTEGEYTITDLSILSGGDGGTARDINESGDVVGSTRVGSETAVATLWRFEKDGYVAELVGDVAGCVEALLQCTSIHARAINDGANVIVGSGTPDPLTSMPVRWTWSISGGWKIHSLPTTVERPGGAARDVNNDGVIAGEIFSITPDESKRSAVVWSQLYSGPTLLPALAGFDLADYSKASGINNAGYVVGSIKRQDAPLERRAVLWVPDPSDPSGSGYMACSLHPTHADYSSVSAVSEPVGDKVKVLGLVRFPDGPTTVTVWTLSATLLGGCPDVTGTFEQIPELARFPLNDINGWGDIVGQDISHGGARPVVWIQGTLVELPSLKGNHGSAQGINNDGRMVGSSSAGGGSHAVLWTSNSNQ